MVNKNDELSYSDISSVIREKEKNKKTIINLIYGKKKHIENAQVEIFKQSAIIVDSKPLIQPKLNDPQENKIS